MTPAETRAVRHLMSSRSAILPTVKELALADTLEASGLEATTADICTSVADIQVSDEEMFAIIGNPV